jgi:hypothetical protein
MSKRKGRGGEKVGNLFHEPRGPSSLDEPIAGIAPSKVACPICGRTFNTKSEMERHKETMHEALEGHSY